MQFLTGGKPHEPFGAETVKFRWRRYSPDEKKNVLEVAQTFFWLERTFMNKKMRYLTTVAMLSALAMIVMLFDFPLPFIPTFYKIDFSEAIVMIGGCILGPVSTIVMEALKILLKLLFKPTSTAFVGELANFLNGIALVLPACLIYARHKTRRGLLTGLGIGILSMTIVGCLFNGFVLLPFYAQLYQMPLAQIIRMGTAINAGITDMFSFLALAVAPFNLIKGVACSLIVFLIYPRMKVLIDRH